METIINKAVDDYNSTYNTSFEALNIFSFGQAEGNLMPDNLNSYPNKGCVYLLLGQYKNVLVIYSADDLYRSLRGKLKQHI